MVSERSIAILRRELTRVDCNGLVGVVGLHIPLIIVPGGTLKTRMITAVEHVEL